MRRNGANYLPANPLAARQSRIERDEDAQPRLWRNIMDELPERETEDLREIANRVALKGRTKMSREDLLAALTDDSPTYDLVGTAEAAFILGVERPRIGRWINKGAMPRPKVWPASGPMWRRVDIEAMVSEVMSRRRSVAA